MDGVLLDNAQFDRETSFLGVDVHNINFVFAALMQDQILTQNRIKSMEKQQPLLAAFLRLTSDYGRNFARFFSWCAVIVLGFAFLYWLIPHAMKGTESLSFLNRVYFSIVVFTTLGFGDFLPVSIIGKILVVAEVSIGYLMLGLLVGILSRRVFGS
jgi:hypothetical protein